MLPNARRTTLPVPISTTVATSPRWSGSTATPLSCSTSCASRRFGIQVLFAFLLIVPFNSGFSKLTSFDRYDYFVTLLCIAAAAALLIAPSIHHRLLFRRRQKAYLVRVGTQLTIVGMVFLTVGLTGILVLILNVMFGAVTAAVAGGLTAVLVSSLWFAIPLARRRKLPPSPDGEAGYGNDDFDGSIRR